MIFLYYLLGSLILFKVFSLLSSAFEPLTWNYRQKTLNHLAKLIRKYQTKGNSQEILKELVFLYQQTYVTLLYPALDKKNLEEKFKKIYNEVFHIENIEDVYEILVETQWKLLSSKISNRIQKLKKKFEEKEKPKLENEISNLKEIVQQDSKLLESETSQTFHEYYNNNVHLLDVKQKLNQKIVPVINSLEYTLFQLNFLFNLTQETELEGSIDFLNQGLLLALNTSEDYPLVFDSIKQMIEKTLKETNLLGHYRKNGYSPLKSNLTKNIWFKESIVSSSIKDLFN